MEPFNAKSIPWTDGVKLARYDEQGLIAVDKRSGLLSHPNKKGDRGRALIEAPYDDGRQAYRILGEEGEERWVYLLNRLDSSTSGILLLTTNEAVRGAVLEAFEQKRVRKVYSALVFGVANRGGREWKDRIRVKKESGWVRAESGGGTLAETRVLNVKVLPGSPVMSLLTLMPLTGRTHQLRIQTAKRGFPIVGDKTYGDFQKNKVLARSGGIKRLCLHCVETTLDYKFGGSTVHFSAVSPSPFEGKGH